MTVCKLSTMMSGLESVTQELGNVTRGLESDIYRMLQVMSDIFDKITRNEKSKTIENSKIKPKKDKISLQKQ